MDNAISILEVLLGNISSSLSPTNETIAVLLLTSIVFVNKLFASSNVENSPNSKKNISESGFLKAFKPPEATVL